MKRTILLLMMPLLFACLELFATSSVTITAGGVGSAVIAGGGTGSVVIQNSATVHYPDITLYDAMDSTTNLRSPTKGSGVFHYNTNVTIGPPLSSSSTASNYCTTVDAFSSVGISTATNINLSRGRAGFYFSWDAANLDDTVFGFINSPDSSPRFHLSKSVTANSWDFKYSDVVVSQVLTVGSTGYVEVAWDINSTNGFCAQIRVNGGSWTTTPTCSGGVPSNTNNNRIGWLGDCSGNFGVSVQGRVDEVLISSDSQRDLYAIRNLGSYPN